MAWFKTQLNSGLFSLDLSLDLDYYRESWYDMDREYISRVSELLLLRVSKLFEITLETSVLN